MVVAQSQAIDPTADEQREFDNELARFQMGVAHAEDALDRLLELDPTQAIVLGVLKCAATNLRGTAQLLGAYPGPVATDNTPTDHDPADDDPRPEES